MTGSHEELAGACRDYVAPDWAGDIEFIALVLLIHQYVKTCDADSHEVLYRVIRGAGQGLCFSGSVANALFSKTLELELHQIHPSL